jgi:hypothetical protein
MRTQGRAGNRLLWISVADVAFVPLPDVQGIFLPQNRPYRGV